MRTPWADLVYWPEPSVRELVDLERRYGLRTPTSADALEVGLVGSCPACGGTGTKFGRNGVVPKHRDGRLRCPGSGKKFVAASRVAVLHAARDHHDSIADNEQKAGLVIKFPTRGRRIV